MNELITTLVEHPWGTFCLGIMVIWWTSMAALGAKKAGAAFGAFAKVLITELLDVGYAQERDLLRAKLEKTEAEYALLDKKNDDLLDELGAVHTKLGKARGLLYTVKTWAGSGRAHTDEVDDVLKETAHTLCDDLTCDYDPSDVTGPIGMFHCPQCGEMVVAGQPHPDYSVINKENQDG